MKNQYVRHNNPLKSSEYGNALWFILVAIGLLAALTLSLTRNSNRMADNLDQEEARLIAESLLRDGNSLAAAVLKLQTINGCSNDEISFENDTLRDWLGAPSVVNPRSPTTGARAYTCHVYDSRGAGLSYKPIPRTALTEASIAAGFDKGWYMTGADSINGLGPESATQTLCISPSSCGDLIAGVTGVNDSVCAAYNKIVGIPGIPVDSDDYTSTFFIGTYGDATSNDARVNVGSGDYTSTLYNVPTACVFSSASPMPHNLIYKALITR